LITTLDLHDVVLVGFSMGTGEVTRYLGKYGSERVSRAVLMGTVPPFLLKTDDNPEGVDQSIFDGMMKAVVADRPAYFSAFFKDFYNVDVLLSDRAALPVQWGRISSEAIQASWNVAVGASAKATLDCIPSWLTDFRDDLPRIDVPTLIIHGDADRILPLEATAARLPKLIKNSRLEVIPGGPHAILWTHADKVNPLLLGFLKEGK
jgi:non-heme chloroperoxidase